jgi:hypothetical protein
VKKKGFFSNPTKALLITLAFDKGNEKEIEREKWWLAQKV